MRRIHHLLSSSVPYTVENYLSKELKGAFQKRGIECQEVVLSGGKLMQYVSDIEESPPDFTLSFSVPLLQEPLYTLTHVPHLAWQTRSLTEAMHYLKNPLGFVGFFDRYHEKIFRKIEMDHFFFLPHAAPGHLMSAVSKDYDIVMFDDLKCTDELKKTWKQVFDSDTNTKILEIIQLIENMPGLTPLEAIFYTDPEIGEMLSPILFCVEEYFKAIKIRTLIESFEGRRIDVFGDHSGNNWYRRLKNAKNVYLHSALPYTEYFEVLKRSKILVRAQMHFDCSDEWAFAAALAGCMVITNKTPYLDEAFEGKLPFYTLQEMHTIKHSSELADELKQHVLSHHTFDTRADLILERMSENRSLSYQ